VSRPQRYSDARISHYDEMNAPRESGGVPLQQAAHNRCIGAFMV